MQFEKKQQLRKFKRSLHQKKMAKLMKKVGGYNSFAWQTIVDRIRIKILKKEQFARAKREATASNA